MSQVNINLNTNQVEINTTNNQISVTNPDNPSVVNITQPVTNIVEVITAGPQGPVGPQGPQGPSGSVDTGSLVTTSSFNAFTSSYNTGSFTGSFTGSLFGTASWANNSVSSSFATTASFAISSSRSVSSSFATTASFAQQADNANFATTAGTSNNTNVLNGFSAATIDQINVGEANSGNYAYIIRAQELEESKHTTINIYNNLNFI